MSLDLHTISIKSGSTMTAQPDRLGVAMMTSVANVIGGSAGAAVVTAVALVLPAVYNVQATPNQDARAFVSGKTTSGFNVTLLPGLAANTLAVGTIDLLITY